MTKRLRIGLLLLAFFIAPAALAIEAYKMAPGEKIVLDGKFDEATWARAPVFDEFWELFPLEKVAARVRT